MAKKIVPIICIAAAVLAVAAVVLLLVLSSAPDYSEQYTEQNLLGTVQVGEDELTAYYFLISDGTGVIDIVKKDGGVHQRIELPLQNEYYASLDYEDSINLSSFKDLNFDGAQDLYVACSVTTENCQGMAWLLDEKTGKFVLSKELSALPTIEAHEKAKHITSIDNTKPEPEPVCYEWKDGRLTAVECNEAH